MKALSMKLLLSQKKNNKVRTLFLILSTLLPLHSFAGVEQVSIQEQKNQLVPFAQAALGEIQSVHESPCIMTNNEWEELQCGWLASYLAQDTQTALGRWVIMQMLYPISDSEKIQEKQNIIRLFMQNESLHRKVRNIIHQIAKDEDALLMYWNPAEYKESGRLFNAASSMYYSIGSSICPSLIKSLNNNRLALEFAAATSLFSTGLSIFKMLGLYGLYAEFNQWAHGASKEFNPIRGIITKGLMLPLNAVNPYRQLTIDEQGSTKYNYTLASYSDALLNGTLGDRFYVGSKNYNHVYKVDIPGVGNKTIWHEHLIGNNDLFIKKRMYNLLGAMQATIPAYFCLKGLYEQSTSVCSRMKFLINTMKDLRAQLIRVSNLIDQCWALTEIVKNNSTLTSTSLAEYFDTLTKKVSTKFTTLLRTLQTNTFTGFSYVYSRGRVLLVHKLLVELKHELVPVLQAVGQLDVYCTLADKCKPNEQGNPAFTLVEFIDSQKPCFNLEHCVIPVINVDQAISNNVTIGATHPAKFVITGPNGCGKSTYLKMIGHALILAQSFGIAPAQKAQMTMFDSLCTSLDPREDLQHAMSSFMAQKASMDTVKRSINGMNNTEKIFFLGDELYRGTVESAAADLTYDFGMSIAQMPNVAACIATHVEKPTTLERATRGLWSNLQVEIQGNDASTFNRSFKIIPGAASWWFHDKIRRDAIINWLSTQFKIDG